MRVLTTDEIKVLRTGEDEETNFSLKLIIELKARGLISVTEDEEYIHYRTTSQGALALRCHEAYIRGI